jgi:hypothetical protein
VVIIAIKIMKAQNLGFHQVISQHFSLFQKAVSLKNI